MGYNLFLGGIPYTLKKNELRYALERMTYI